MAKMSNSESGKLGYIASKQTQQKQKERRILDYNKNPNICKKCNDPLPYIKRKNKYCSHSCAASKTNTLRCKTDKCILPSCKTIVKLYQTKYCCRKHYEQHRILNRNVLVEDGLGSSLQVKTYLIEKYGNKCLDENCLWDFDIRPINIELEHIDGDSENNNLENCTLLCPNCHSLTPTYKAKNKGNGRHSRRNRYHSGLSY